MNPKTEVILAQIDAIRDQARLQLAALNEELLLAEYGVEKGVTLHGEDGESFLVEEVLVREPSPENPQGFRLKGVLSKPHSLKSGDLMGGYWKAQEARHAN